MGISYRVIIALALTGVTGAAGLIYEVTWQKYLAVLLGAQSEASAAILGDRLRARHPESQTTEAIIACNILNRMARLGLPESFAVRA
jgi:hypothetical protein